MVIGDSAGEKKIIISKFKAVNTGHIGVNTGDNTVLFMLFLCII